MHVSSANYIFSSSVTGKLSFRQECISLLGVFNESFFPSHIFKCKYIFKVVSYKLREQDII